MTTVLPTCSTSRASPLSGLQQLPADGATGKSLYDFNSYGPTVAATGSTRAAKVSFDRPVRRRLRFGSVRRQLVELGALLHRLAGADRIRRERTRRTWILTPAALGCWTSRDFCRWGMTSTGRRRCWTPRRRLGTPGVNLGFFGSNTAYWQVRFEPSAAGVANRVMVCYKSADRGPGEGLDGDGALARPAGEQAGAEPGRRPVHSAPAERRQRARSTSSRTARNWVWEGHGLHRRHRRCRASSVTRVIG